MSKFVKKPVVIEAMTFDELVEYGLKNTDNIVNGMPWSFSINGYPITHASDSSYLITTLEGNHLMSDNDMLIIGIKGEIYPCKMDIFKMTYDSVDIDYEKEYSFSSALEALKEGKLVGRKGWNGKGMFIFLVPGSEFNVNRAPLLGIFPEGTEIKYHAHIDMKTADGMIVPWLASQTDMLAKDWIIFLD
jgi:hypothetical protein